MPAPAGTLLLQRGEHLAGRALARLDRSVEVALEVLRGVLAREVAGARGLRLGAREPRVLPDLEVGVRALRPAVRRPGVHRRAAVPRRRDAGHDGLGLLEEALGQVLRRAARERGAGPAAGVVDEDARGAGLGAADLPGGLIAGVGVAVAGEAERAPVAALEPDVELGVGAHA